MLTASSALMPSHGAPPACDVLPKNSTVMVVMASVGTMPEMPDSMPVGWIIMQASRPWSGVSGAKT